MHLSPEKFIEQYTENQQTFFEVYEGTAIVESGVIMRHTNTGNGVSKEQALGDNLDKLTSLFADYPDGCVTIVTHGARNGSDVIKTKVLWSNPKAPQPTKKHRGGLMFLRSYLQFTAPISLAINTIMFLLFAFYKDEINPFLWSELDRGMCSWLFAFFLFGPALFFGLTTLPKDI